jgi:hypothetical protein
MYDITPIKIKLKIIIIHRNKFIFVNIPIKNPQKPIGTMTITGNTFLGMLLPFC